MGRVQFYTRLRQILSLLLWRSKAQNCALLPGLDSNQGDMIQSHVSYH